MRFLLDFIRDMYLKDFIAKGGSKIKFVTGRQGSGKTYFLNELQKDAETAGYITVRFSARDIWLHSFLDIYLAILSQCDMPDRIRECADEVIRRMEYNPGEIPEGETFTEYINKQASSLFSKRALREELTSMFLKNPILDNNFAAVCAQLCGDVLGHPMMEEGEKELLYAWLNADKSMKLTIIRALGLAPFRITKTNARHMLRSLSEVIRLSGHAGLLVLVDDLDILQDKSGTEEIHYASVRRNDAYESIRQLIDDIDTMHNLMFVFAFDRKLMDNEKTGLKSYQALWMRIQNEVGTERINRFADILDLDRLAIQVYDSDYILEMSLEFADEAEKNSRNADILDEEKISDLLEQARFGSVGLPQLIKEATLKGEKA